MVQSGNKLRRGLVVLGLAGILVAPVGARAESAAREFGVGTALVLGNLLYGPAKLVYATGGSLIAGMAYAVSGGDGEVAMPILNAAVRGDYLIQPDHLRGQRGLEFVGRDPEHERLLSQSLPTGAGPGQEPGDVAAGGGAETDDPRGVDEGF